MNLYERNQKVRAFFNEKIDTYDDVHSTFMETKKELADNLDKDAKKLIKELEDKLKPKDVPKTENYQSKLK